MLALTSSGQILFAGPFDQVDDFPRPGLVRLLDSSPQRDFRVLASGGAYRSNGVARIQVVRTGDTASSGFVEFATENGTARAGDDYLPQSGTLNFAPLEFSKTVLVPLLAKTGLTDRLFFHLALRNPTPGYTNSVPIPIALFPDLVRDARLVAGSYWPGFESFVFTLNVHSTWPGITYTIEMSTDLKNWEWADRDQATGTTMVFETMLLEARTSPPILPRFFRVRTE